MLVPQGFDDGVRDGKNDIQNGISYQGHCPENIVQFPNYCTGYHLGYDGGYNGNFTAAGTKALEMMQQQGR